MGQLFVSQLAGLDFQNARFQDLVGQGTAADISHVFAHLNLGDAIDLAHPDGQPLGPLPQFRQRNAEHAESRHLLKRALLIQVKAQGGFESRQGHLVEAEGAHEGVAFNLLNELFSSSQDARLRATEQLVAAEQHQVHACGDAIASHRFSRKAETPEVQERAAADVVDHRQAPLLAQLD